MYFKNITNPELQYFHGLTVPNFTIKLSDLLESDLFKVETIITGQLYRVYPLFYTNEIRTDMEDCRILDNKCLIIGATDEDAYITFISDEDAEIIDYVNYAEYYDIGDTLTTAQYNGIVSLFRQNTVNTDNVRLTEIYGGDYGDYEFNLEDCSFLDNGILITDDTLTAGLKVRLTNPVFHYSNYTLILKVLHYTDVNILDDVTSDDFTVIDTLEVLLEEDEWIDIPLDELEQDYVILFDAEVSITHDKPVIQDWINKINLTADPSIIQTGDTSEFYAIGFDNGNQPVGAGHTIYFYEKLEPTLTMSVSADIIQTGDTTEIYTKVKDEDGSLAKGVKVYFYTKEE